MQIEVIMSQGTVRVGQAQWTCGLGAGVGSDPQSRQRVQQLPAQMLEEGQQVQCGCEGHRPHYSALFSCIPSDLSAKNPYMAFSKFSFCLSYQKCHKEEDYLDS